jgi:hypothetical protein
MKRLILLLSASALAFLPARADGGPTVVQPGLFSYQAPPGWTVQESPVSKYKISLAAPVNGFAANINVVIENAPVSMNDYVTASLNGLKSATALQDVKILSQEPFTTAAGLAGQKIVVTDTMNKIGVRQTFYFFDGGSDNKLVITASCAQPDGAADAVLFDAAMKTLTLE